jgi:hypothetical protein
LKNGSGMTAPHFNNVWRLPRVCTFCMGNHFLSRPYFKTFDGDNADISITNVISHNTISGKQK